MAPDGTYLFWGSNAWGSGGVAKYIDPTNQCQQLMHTPITYSNLPTTGSGLHFHWKDQYNQTSRTNYHTMIKKSNGDTALIFEECHGQDTGSTRGTWCVNNNEFLSTTGFDAGGTPSNLGVRSGATWNCSKNINNCAGVTARASHPAVSGGQNADGTWLLFFMRGKSVWYSKVKEN